MKWEKLISNKRLGLEDIHYLRKDDRSEFQRDYDRLIFSAPFRRLQNKTQVFPLPGSIFVHNRLTHSLEVSCVGRSLGNIVSSKLIEKYPDLSKTHISEIGSIVSTACLAHDLGNPPFGHSGEKAIATFFSEGKGLKLKNKFTENQWNDLIHFEGNANALRLLTHQFQGRRKGGFVLTYSTLASVVKYPFSSQLAGDKQKFGFFISEEEDYKKIAHELGIRQLSKDGEPLRFVRHPLVYLVEAADDICYQMMDIEDAYRLKILTFQETVDLYSTFLTKDKIESVENIYHIVTDKNEQIAYLRTLAISNLIKECSEAFMRNEELILEGEFNSTLIKSMSEKACNAYRKCSDTAFKKIYCSRDVVDIELAGFKIINTLIELMVEAVNSPEKAYSQLLMNRVSNQYNIKDEDLYTRIQGVLDFISGMTDVYALDLYRKINGNSIPAL